MGAGALPVFSLYFGKTKLTNRLWSEIFYTISVCGLARGGWGGGDLRSAAIIRIPLHERSVPFSETIGATDKISTGTFELGLPLALKLLRKNSTCIRFLVPRNGVTFTLSQ